MRIFQLLLLANFIKAENMQIYRANKQIIGMFYLENLMKLVKQNIKKLYGAPNELVFLRLYLCFLDLYTRKFICMRVQ